MKVHHLNCGTMRPPGLDIVCHVLLVETPGGLLLVDTGFGLQDVAHPGRLGPTRRLMRPVLDARETAARQVEALGFSCEDVRDIALTHLDLDHIGGLADFPHARVHLTVDEARGGIHRPSLRERLRFRSAQWAHDPRFVEHAPSGEAWRGFAAAQELSDGVVMVALPGHTRGHAALAVDAGSRWVLHAGDAFYDHHQLSGGRAPAALAAMESLVAFDLRAVHANHERLAELHARAEPDLLIVCAHDPALLARARA